MLDYIDPKLVIVAITYKWWWPVFMLVWRAANPYPGLGTPKDFDGRALEGPQVEPLDSEEWAAWRLRRQMERRGDNLPALRVRPQGGPGGVLPSLRPLGRPSATAGLKRVPPSGLRRRRA